MARVRRLVSAGRMPDGYHDICHARRIRGQRNAPENRNRRAFVASIVRRCGGRAVVVAAVHARGRAIWPKLAWPWGFGLAWLIPRPLVSQSCLCRHAFVPAGHPADRRRGSVHRRQAASSCSLRVAGSTTSLPCPTPKQENLPRARFVRAPAWPVEPSDIVDTTGAGDCFMAAFIYGMTHRVGMARYDNPPPPPMSIFFGPACPSRAK